MWTPTFTAKTTPIKKIVSEDPFTTEAFTWQQMSRGCKFVGDFQLAYLFKRSVTGNNIEFGCNVKAMSLQWLLPSIPS